MPRKPTSEFERRLDLIMSNDLTRRRLLRQGAAGALSVSAIGYLAACGGDELSGGAKEETKAIAKGQIASSLTFANWPYYIDVDDKTGRHPSLDMFKEKYGTTVKYIEEINDNTEFFGKVRPEYASGSSGGRDLHVVTDWLCARMKRLGFVQKFDKSAMPNAVKNIEDGVASPDFDPNREYSMPWASGQVGLIYRRDLVGGDLTSVNDLFDPKFKGKVTFLSEMRDSVGSVLLADGVKPEDATLDQVMAAIEQAREGLEGRPDPALHGQRLREGHPQGRLARPARLVRRRGPARARQRERGVQEAGRGLHDLHGLDADPGRSAARVHRREADRLLLRPGGPGGI